MDSGNSGSMQSSSGGDEEYDSRPESVSAFLNSSGHVLVSSMPNTRPPPLPPASHPQSGTSTSTHPSFDPLSNYMEYASLRSPQPPSTVNSLLNLDMAWARGLRSDPNCTDIGGVVLMGSSSSAVAPPSSLRGAYHGGGGGGGGIISPSHAAQSPGVVSDRPPPPPGSSSGSDPPQAVRNSKKRSRASRRAPTTVLTTDTSNFRAMVQEFTGIPAPPFSAASFPRTRFDLFGSSALRSGSTLADPGPPPYLLRPFAHKVVQPTSSSSSPAAAMLDVLSSNTTATAANINGNAATSNNLQHQNLLNVGNNNPMFTFQSLLQSTHPSPPPKYSPLPVFNSKQQPTIPDLTDFNTVGNNAASTTTTTHLSSLSGLMAAASDGLATRTEHPPNWVDGDGHGDHDQANHHRHHHHHHQLRSFGGGGHYDDAAASQRVGNCKLNYAGSSSTDFHAEKGSENNVTSRGEGMVDSWICSSD